MNAKVNLFIGLLLVLSILQSRYVFSDDVQIYPAGQQKTESVQEKIPFKSEADFTQVGDGVAVGILVFSALAVATVFALRFFKLKLIHSAVNNASIKIIDRKFLHANNCLYHVKVDRQEFVLIVGPQMSRIESLGQGGVDV